MSWFTVRTVVPFEGHITVDGRPWAFTRVRVDYRGGGHVVATIPQWLHGMLRMGASPSRSAGKAWHRHWADLEARGLVVVHERETAAQARERVLSEDPGSAQVA